MKPIPSFLVANQARTDLARINAELYDLQRQTASGNKAADLKGYGQEAGRIVSARAAIAQSTARVDAAGRIAARLDIQDVALQQAAASAAQLKQDIFTALSSGDASFLSAQLEAAFRQATEALNTTYEGIPLFSGDRRDAAPVQASNLNDLAGELDAGTLFAESTRTATIDLGAGAVFEVAPKASAASSQLYHAFRDLYAFLQAGVDTPITGAQRNALNDIATTLDGGHRQVLEAQGINGNTQKNLERTVTRLTAHADLLSSHLAKVAESDLAEVAMRLSAAQTQYQAAASVFSQIKDLSLVNFLD